MGSPISGLTVGSQKRCDKCIADNKKNCNEEEIIKFLNDKGFNEMRTGMFFDSKTGSDTRQYLPSEPVVTKYIASQYLPEPELEYSASDYDPSDIVLPPTMSEQKREEAGKRAKRIMEREDTNDALGKGYYTPEGVSGAKRVSYISAAPKLDENIFALNKYSKKPSQTGSAGGGRKKRKKTKRRRKSKRSKRTRRR